MSVACLELDDALADARAQVEEAHRERDEARRTSEYLHARWTETAARADSLEATLADARASAEQGVKVAEALAAEKAALASRVTVLEAALRGLLAVVQHCYPGVPDICECDPSVGSVCECCADRRARDAARRALEVES